jgi:hypothetical protein
MARGKNIFHSAASFSKIFAAVQYFITGNIC